MLTHLLVSVAGAGDERLLQRLVARRAAVGAARPVALQQEAERVQLPADSGVHERRRAAVVHVVDLYKICIIVNEIFREISSFLKMPISEIWKFHTLKD